VIDGDDGNVERWREVEVVLRSYDSILNVTSTPRQAVTDQKRKKKKKV
jgi:hypothetical protein